MKEALQIIKIGGSLIDDYALLTSFMDQLDSIAAKIIVVHGGGKMATSLADKLGIETTLIEGRRLTDKDTLDVIVMVYAGLINKKIVAGLQARNINALGLSGADANIIVAHKRQHPEIEYGEVGDIDSVSVDPLHQFLASNLTPVVCPLTHDRQGHLLNTNADTIAAEMAIAMSEHYKVSLKYCFEYPGVMLDLEIDTPALKSIDATFAQKLKAKGKIHSGLIPKIDNALKASSQGVQKVCICGIDNLVNEKNVTWIL